MAGSEPHFVSQLGICQLRNLIAWRPMTPTSWLKMLWAPLSGCLMLLSAPGASALPGVFALKGGEKAVSRSTQVVVMTNDQSTVVSVMTDYDGPMQPFAFVLPVPKDVKLDDVKTLKRASVERLEELTAPRFHEFWEMDPCEEGKPEQIWERSLAASSGTDFLGVGDMFEGTKKAPKEMRTKVEADFRDEGSEYTFHLVSTNVEAWLQRKGYQLPAGASLAGYADSAFLVAETNPQKSELGRRGEALLSPIRFATSQPLKLAHTLGLANAEGKQELVIYTVHPQRRMAVANYDSVFSPTNLQVDFQVKERMGEFYAALHDQMLEKNAQAFVAEYAWDTQECGQPCPNAPLRVDELLTLGADVFEESVPESQRNPEPPSRSEEEEKAYKAAKPDERKAMDELAREVARRKALLERNEKYILARVHHRYDAKGLPRDVELKTAPPARGGVGVPEGEAGTLETNVQAGAERNQLQTRFVHLHPNKKAIKCEAPQRYRWGKPPSDYRGARKIWVADQLASRDRGKIKPADVVLTAYQPLGLQGAGTKAAEAAAVTPEAADAEGKSDCDCAVVGDARRPGSLVWLWGLALLAWPMRRFRGNPRSAR